MSMLRNAIDAGIVSEESCFCGLHPADLRALQSAGYGAVQVLVRYRSAEDDDRSVLTVDQVLALPGERSEIILDVFAPLASQPL